MRLSVYVGDRAVATLESVGDFQNVMTYRHDVSSDDFVSLTMRVREQPFVWDDVLLPYFQMNLPEGHLLRVLQERFGPVVGANPMVLLSVVGRNTIGRVRVAPEGAVLDEPAKAVDVAALLNGDNSEEAFGELVREHAASGVSGVVPKFLDTQATTLRISPTRKTTFFSHRHIIKGSSSALPFVSLNEHLCMEVVRHIMPAAHTQVSSDGQVLVVDRFDVDHEGRPHWGMEDFCVLLGLRPAAKYDTTWERIARAVRDLAPMQNRKPIYREMTSLLLLTYALRNADCHAKNIALRYSTHADVHLAPAYDMLTTAAYDEYAKNAPAISFMGKKTWHPGKNLPKFIAGTFFVPYREQVEIVESIAKALADVAPRVRQAMEQHPGFYVVGKRMLLCWSEGITSLFDERSYGLGRPDLGAAFDGLVD
jgi:serine/threonine-protein kinase HipA